VRVIWFPVLMFFLIHLLCLLGLEINWATLKCCWIYETSIAFFFINEILIFLEMRMRGRVTHDYGLLNFIFFWVGVEYGTPLFCELLLAASIEELFTVRFWGYS
jgi:hypothetical protein